MILNSLFRVGSLDPTGQNAPANKKPPYRGFLASDLLRDPRGRDQIEIAAIKTDTIKAISPKIKA